MLNSRTYLYQRNGVFYIRLRMKTTGRLTASLPSHNRYKLASVSLRTKDRRTAMAHSRHIKSALKAIHADNPNASYEELREHLKTIVEWELSVSRDDLNDPESYQLYVDQYDDIKSNLREAVATEHLTVDQHRYINDVIGVLKACQDRLKGDSSGLLSYLEPETGSLRPSVSLSVLAEPEVPDPKALTLASLIEQYEQENAQNWKPATLSENRASHSTLIEIFDYLDIQDVGKATRSD
ncbi:integrase, partial [Escherichia coli]|nr:integrase [Escherichia coli]EKQ0479457.1 integrase [Escherichia coli]ELH7839176.1 integrase [Escherichia coli]ELK1035720.1 integrase [Escherichia coli]